MPKLRHATEHQSWDLCMKSGQSPFKLCCATLANRRNRHNTQSPRGKSMKWVKIQKLPLAPPMQFYKKMCVNDTCHVPKVAELLKLFRNAFFVIYLPP